MADDTKGTSVFRAALEAASGHVLQSAFPQLTGIARMLQERQKDDAKGDSSGQTRDSSKRSAAASNTLDNNALIKVVDEGFNEIHDDLAITNIILTSQLEQQTRINKALEKLSGGGIGVGGGGIGGALGGMAEGAAGGAMAEKFLPMIMAAMPAIMAAAGAAFLVYEAKGHGSPGFSSSDPLFGGIPHSAKEFLTGRKDDPKGDIDRDIELKNHRIEILETQIDDMKKRGENVDKQIASLNKQKELLQKDQDQKKSLGDDDSDDSKDKEKKDPNRDLNKTASAETIAEQEDAANQIIVHKRSRNGPPMPTYSGMGRDRNMARNAAMTGSMLNRMGGSVDSGATHVAKGALAKNQKEAYDAAIAEGLSPESAKVLVANMSGESLADPSNNHWDVHHMSQGIVQWDPERAGAIKEHFGKEPKDMTVAEQTKASIWEMKNNPAYKQAWAALSNTNMSDRQKMEALVGNYERPRDVNSAVNQRMGFHRGLNVDGAKGGGGDENAPKSGNYKGLRLADASHKPVAGGDSTPGLIAAAHYFQDNDPQLNQFTALNDEAHKRGLGSGPLGAHGQGLAFDTTSKDGDYEAMRQRTRERMKALGYKEGKWNGGRLNGGDGDYQIEPGTGDHMHFQWESADAAARFNKEHPFEKVDQPKQEVIKTALKKGTLDDAAKLSSPEAMHSAHLADASKLSAAEVLNSGKNQYQLGANAVNVFQRMGVDSLTGLPGNKSYQINNRPLNETLSMTKGNLANAAEDKKSKNSMTQVSHAFKEDSRKKTTPVAKDGKSDKGVGTAIPTDARLIKLFSNYGPYQFN